MTLSDLQIRNPTRCSHQWIRYEYCWRGYQTWVGATVPAQYNLNYLEDEQYNPHISHKQFELIGQTLAAA